MRKNYEPIAAVLLGTEVTGSVSVLFTPAVGAITQGPCPQVVFAPSLKGGCYMYLSWVATKGPEHTAMQWVNMVMFPFKKVVIFTLWNI
jgi:hypothetical protein